MIPKIICWVFGHKFRERAWSPESTQLCEPVFYWKYEGFCYRCGADLKEHIKKESV